MSLYYSLKNYVEIGFIILYSPVPAKTFSEKFNLSSYEFSQDAGNVSVLCRDYGIDIDFTHSMLAYYVKDYKKFEKYKRSLISFYHTHINTYWINNDFLIQMYLDKRFCWSKNYLPIDALADEIGCSRSSIRKPMKSLRESFHDSYIEIVSVPHHGLKATGSEESFRSNLLSTYIYFDENVIQFAKYPWNVQLNYDDYSVIFNIVCSALESKKISIDYIERKRICRYIFIQRARIKNGFLIGDNACQFSKDVNHSSLYEFAEALVHSTNAVLGELKYSDEEIEILALNLLIVGCDRQLTSSIINAYYLEEYEELSKRTFQILNTYSLSVKHSFYENELMKRLEILILRAHTKHLSELGWRINGRSSITYSYPITHLLCKEIANAFGEYYKCNVSLSQITEIGKLLYYMMQNQMHINGHLRIGIAARDSIIESVQIGSLLRKSLPERYYDCIEFCDYKNLPDSSQKVKEKFDLIVTAEKYETDDIYVSFSQFNYQIGRLSTFIKGMRKIINENDRAVIETDRMKWNSIEKKLLLAKIANNVGLIESDVRNNIKEIYVENTVYLLLISNKIKRVYIQIGELDEKIIHNNKRIGKYVVCGICINDENAFAVETFLYGLQKKDGLFNKLVEHPTVKTINSYLSQILE